MIVLGAMKLWLLLETNTFLCFLLGSVPELRVAVPEAWIRSEKGVETLVAAKR